MLIGLIEYRLSWQAMFALTSALLILFTELGYRCGLRRSDEGIESMKPQAGVILGALMALLGLLLAFSFGMVESRFSTRKALILAEANAIRTVYLQAEMLPEPYGDRIEALLREYVKLRMPSTPEAIEVTLERSAVLHDDLWTEAVGVARDHPGSEVVGLFVPSLNNVIDLHESRVTVSLYQRLPGPILAALHALSILTMLVLGWNSGLARQRIPLATVAVILAVSAVIVLIVELDRPTGIRISMRAMEDVQRTITQRTAPHPN